MDYQKIKNDRKEYLNCIGYENNLKHLVKIYIPGISGYMLFEHDHEFISQMDGYLEIAEFLGDEYLIGPGGVFPIQMARDVYEDVERVNYLMTKELFTKQNTVDSINRDDYESDEDFELAVNSIDWEFDIDQVFNFHG